jgi:hypothetical protein
MRAKGRGEAGDSYMLLPQFLCSYSDQNPEVVIAPQVDDRDCFMGLFVTIPCFQEVFSKLALSSNCTSMERILNVVYMMGCSSSSSQSLKMAAKVHMGLAHVPVESGLHMVWILLLLNHGGLDVSPFSPAVAIY